MTTEAKPRSKSGYLPTLDGWRAIAILLVFCSHTKFWSHHLDPLRIPLNSYGYLGVDIFFALSGLLICHRLLEEESMLGRISLKGFYLRRAFRIFPPAFLYLGVVAILGLVRVIPTDWATWWSALLFMRNYATALLGDGPQSNYTGHFWSLAVEEHFYLLLPAILIFLPRRRKAVLLALTVLALAWIGLYAHLTPLATRSFYWYRRSDLHIAGLLFPAWLTLVIAAPQARERMRRILHPALLPLFLVLLVGAKYLDKYEHPGLSVQQRIERYDPASPLNAIDLEKLQNPSLPVDRPVYPQPMTLGNPATLLNFLVPILAPFLILATLLHPAQPISRFLELAPMRYVGRLSYSLYLWQQIFWAVQGKGWPVFALQRSPWVGLLLTFAAAMASFYLVERPLIRMGHRLAPPATAGHRDTPTAPATIV